MEYSEFAATPIRDLHGMPTRARNVLLNGMLPHDPTVGDIISLSDRELLSTPNFGKKSLKELRILIEAYAMRHGICIAEFKDVQTRLYSVIVDGLEMVGEKKMVEELLKAIKNAKRTLQIKRDIKDVIESISPSQTPFFTVRKGAENNDQQWVAKL